MNIWILKTQQCAQFDKTRQPLLNKHFYHTNQQKREQIKFVMELLLVKLTSHATSLERWVIYLR